jgi:uncharacterized repeat protein (TIGR02543 family)
VNTLTRTGYSFSGWNTLANGTGNAYGDGASYPFTADATLYAQWTQNTVTHSIPLVIGWNLVSFKIHPTSTLIADVLASISGNFDLVYAWDASNGTWMKYDPNVPFGNSLTNLDETMGFWIKMTTADTLDVSGTAPVSTNIALKTGWNLVGFPASTSLTLPDAFSLHGVGNNAFQVFAYHANDTDLWKIYDSSAPAYSNDLSVMAPGWGYWVKVSGPQIWVVGY